MSFRGNADTPRLCGAVDPTVRQQSVYAAEIRGMKFNLRPVYIANDDLAFINQCTNQWDELASAMHREPYFSVAQSDNGQTFIISLGNEPVCVAEVHHALLYFTGEEFTPEEDDYLVRLFCAVAMDISAQTSLIRFFTDYCRRFKEVERLIIKANALNKSALTNAGFAAIKNADGADTDYYYYSTSKEKE